MPAIKNFRADYTKSPLLLFLSIATEKKDCNRFSDILLSELLNSYSDVFILLLQN